MKMKSDLKGLHYLTTYYMNKLANVLANCENSSIKQQRDFKIFSKND